MQLQKCLRYYSEHFSEDITFYAEFHPFEQLMNVIKFIYSEKATKFWEIFTVDLTVTTLGQIYGGDFAKICGLHRIYEL